MQHDFNSVGPFTQPYLTLNRRNRIIHTSTQTLSSPTNLPHPESPRSSSRSRSRGRLAKLSCAASGEAAASAHAKAPGIAAKAQNEFENFPAGVSKASALGSDGASGARLSRARGRTAYTSCHATLPARVYAAAGASGRG